MSLPHQPSDDGAAAFSGSEDCMDMIGGRLECVGRLGTGGAVLFRTSMAPGQVVPLHRHSDPECFYVLAGRLDVFLRDASPRWHHLPAGRSVVVTGGMPHAIRNPARASADIMVLTNARLAAFFRDAGRPAKAGSAFRPAGPEDFARVARAAEAYGYWLSSPAEHDATTGEVPSQAGA